MSPTTAPINPARSSNDRDPCLNRGVKCRFTTPELKEYEEKVLSAEDKIKDREFEIFVRLREEAAAQTPRLLQTGQVLATIDPFWLQATPMRFPMPSEI